jgi:hypothetical protein
MMCKHKYLPCKIDTKMIQKARHSHKFAFPKQHKLNHIQQKELGMLEHSHHLELLCRPKKLATCKGKALDCTPDLKMNPKGHHPCKFAFQQH